MSCVAGTPPIAAGRKPDRYRVHHVVLHVVVMLAIAFNGLVAVAGSHVLTTAQTGSHAAIHPSGSGDHGLHDTGLHDAGCHEAVAEDAPSDCQPDAGCAAVCAHAAALLSASCPLVPLPAVRIEDRVAEYCPSRNAHPPIRPPITMPA